MSDSRTAPTLNDVAREAGVSTATVSRCLNAPDKVVEKTRIRVLKAVDRLGYTPNFAAQVMAAKRSFTIGAIIPTMDNAIFARGLQAFQDELRDRGYTLLVSSSVYSPEIEQEQIRALVARGADGLLLIGHDRPKEVYDYLDQHQVPALVAWSHLPDALLPSVGFDNHGALRGITEKVIDMGHRNIAMISGVTKGNDRARDRVKGLRDALRENGLDPEQTTVIETSYDIEQGALAFRDLMASTPRPTAIICGNDVLAVGAIREAHKLGIAVPDEVSITGFDDMELANVVTPSVTTVHVPHREMGRKAARELTEMVAGTSKGRSTCLDTSVVMRESLGPPPSQAR
ncbi:LacI family DNA-binding transcriptional regulator [uncultured Shimia sp.]|uniref:LacI family DNA-binding transcriptional regulator n=1 Tax=uncultured Shimia sp. TaxID=573152 RepID=UPI00261D04B4|nr:LacI family DNA-binding transcriptional regulator [uncultured Shimia sp.]